ncbi:MAG: alkaline phosphatase D family protein [Actinomycetes bacterium]
MPDGRASPQFRHGVASGDPQPDGVLIWTRVTPEASGATEVRWRVAADRGLGEVVAQGEAEARADHDFTVRVDVRGLDPSTTYFYGFEAGDGRSPVGRTRTGPSGSTDNVRIGVVSCANWVQGYFNAYGHLAERDVDLVVHVGDYLYETADRRTKLGRVHQPRRRLRTLADYRTRHAQYRTDPDLQRLHAQHPVVAVWDDHEVAGNAWRDGALDHDPEKDGDWGERRAAAVQAYLEWLPVRQPDPRRPDRIYRTVGLGDVARLHVLDTRLAGRDRPAAAGGRPVASVLVRDRRLLGDEQWAWLQEELRAPVRWRLLGNQVMMAPLRLVQVPRPLRRVMPGLVAGGTGVNAGQWDGYPQERQQLFDHLRREGIGNVVVLTGDLHSSWAAELTLDAGNPDVPPVGVEMVTPSVTSRTFGKSLAPPLPGARALLRRVIASQNRHVRWFDLDAHGYVVVDVTAERVHAEWWHIDTVARPGGGEELAAAWVVRDGDPHLTPASEPLPPR